MSVPSESLLSIGLSFDGFGQLVTLQQAFNKTGQVINIFKNLCNSTSKDLKSLKKSLNKTFPQINDLMEPIFERMQGGLKKFSENLKNVHKGVQSFVDLGKSGIYLADSFKKVQATVPAALKVFQDPKQIFIPDQWIMAIFPAIDAIGQLKDGSLEFLKAISNIPGIDKFTAQIGALASKAFKYLSNGLTSVIPKIWAFTAALLANPVTWIVIGVIALGTTIFLLWKNWDKMVVGFKKGFQWLKSTLSKALDWVVGLIAALGKVLLLPIRIVTVIGVIIISLLSKVFEKIGAMLGSIWGKIVNVFALITNFIGSVIGSIFTRIAGIIGPVIGLIRDLVVNAFIGIGNTIGSLFSSLWNTAVNFIINSVNFIGSMIGGILDFFNGIIDSITSAFNSVWSGIESVFQSIGKMFGDIVPSWVKGVFNWAINPDGNSAGKNSPKPAALEPKVITKSTTGDRQAANQLNQSQNNQTRNTKNTKVDKIEINLTGGKSDQQTAKIVRDELAVLFNEQNTAALGG